MQDKLVEHMARALARGDEPLILDYPPEPVAVKHGGLCYLAYDRERITFYLNKDGSIASVERGEPDTALWPMITDKMLRDDVFNYKRLEQGLTDQLVAGAKRMIADGKLKCLS